MHKVLQTDERARYICQHVNDAGDLARVARSQKALGDIALDVLWDDIALKALLYLFSPDVVGLNASGAKVKACS
jgi:hypothetical protein